MHYSCLTVHGSRHLLKDFARLQLRGGLIYPTYKDLLLQRQDETQNSFPLNQRQPMLNRVFVAREYGEVRGWLLFTPGGQQFPWYEIMVYVSRKHRNRGIATHLMKLAAKRWEKELKRKRYPRTTGRATDLYLTCS